MQSAGGQFQEFYKSRPFDVVGFTPYLAMALLALVFVAFALELRSPDVIAFCGAVRWWHWQSGSSVRTTFLA
jgi:hypothetical protein